MKIYRSLPEKVVIRSVKYVLDANLSALKQIPTDKKYVKVNVLAKSLEGKTDLHGNPYKPSVFIFTESGEYVFDRRKIDERLKYLKSHPSEIETDFDGWIERIRKKNGTTNDYK